MLLKNNPVFTDKMIALLPIWKFSSEGKGWKKALKEGDWHAGWLETSMVMALEPDKVRINELELDNPETLKRMIDHPDNYLYSEKIVDDECVVPRTSQRPEIQVGVMGRPEKASPELGREVVNDAIKTISRKIKHLEKNADGVYKNVDFTPEPLILE
jgi:creatinine amidohydrolase/Fe(II)-dependent formamide hydrolase-like protein